MISERTAKPDITPLTRRHISRNTRVDGLFMWLEWFRKVRTAGRVVAASLCIIVVGRLIMSVGNTGVAKIIC